MNLANLFTLAYYIILGVTPCTLRAQTPPQIGLQTHYPRPAKTTITVAASKTL